MAFVNVKVKVNGGFQAGGVIFRYGFPFASVAQLVEQVTLNHLVLGSSPSRGTT